MNLLELFSTDRRLLETRGSLIIRQLCLNLNNERIYRTFAEILEKEDVRIVIIPVSYLEIELCILGSRVCQCYDSKIEHDPHHGPGTGRFP